MGAGGQGGTFCGHSPSLAVPAYSREKYAALARRSRLGILSSMQDDALQALFPTLSNEKIRIVAESLDEYLALAWEIMRDADASLDRLPIPGQDSDVGKVEQHT